MIEWRPVKGYEGLYEVSNLGQVRSFYSGEAKILKPYVDKDGYLCVHLHKNGKGYAKKVHRLVASAFIPNIGDKPQVNHIDGDKTNNTVDNLEWVTSKENMHHAWETGLCKALKGENHPMYGKQLSEETKKKMSEARKGKYTGKYTGKKNPRARKVICITTGETFNYIREGAKKYNVAHQNISDCCKGKIKSAGKHPTTGEKLVWRYI